MRPVYNIANRGTFRMGFPNLPAPGSFDFSPPDLTLQPGALDAANFSPAAAPEGAAPGEEPPGQVPLRTQYVLPATEEGDPQEPPEEGEAAPSESGPGTLGWVAIGAVGIGLIAAVLS